MPLIPGVNHSIPRNDPVSAYTMGGIVIDAGMSVDEFRKLL